MILIADKVQDFKCVIKMYEIIFTKKQPMFDQWYITNLMYNLQFFLHHVSPDDANFISLAKDYIKFLMKNNINVLTFDFIHKDVYKKSGIILDNPSKEITNKPQTFSENQCLSSKNILIHTGFCDIRWNYNYMLNNALGGSEKAVAYLSRCFPKEYNIYVTGCVLPEQFDNVRYIPLEELQGIIKETPFHTVIVSRYISFYEMFQNCSYYQSFIWAHDTELIPYGCNLDVSQILKKWNKYINGCICLTEWHKQLYLDKYPQLHNKIHIIHNGLDVCSFKPVEYKIKNKFIYSSRPERGLQTILQLWPQILNEMPDATLSFATYGKFPSNDYEFILKNMIDSYPSIHFLGNLKVSDLYEEMKTAEYWLYPTSWPETSCITALEMLMSEVICLYYPVAGLINTVGTYGIQIEQGHEVDAIVNLTEKQKNLLRKNGRKYAENCSWENRYKLWCDHLSLKTKYWCFYCPINFEQNLIKQYIENLNELYTDYNIYLSCDKKQILEMKPTYLTFVFTIFDKDIQLNLPDTNFSYLNTEPLNIPIRLESVLNILNQYPHIKYHDYSKSNIEILKCNNIDTSNFNYLPYVCSTEEVNVLTKLNKETTKIYDFGLIISLGGDVTERRKKIVDFLVQNKFTVNIISGWGIDRDKELAKCKYILNIHGFCNMPSAIFEHIRCDRLLAAGFHILSEESLHIDDDFIKKYSNLKLIKYEDFFNRNIIEKQCVDVCYNKLFVNSIKIIDCFIFYNELELLTYRLNILNSVVDYFIIVESTHTFNGKPKSLYFKENIELFSKFKHKIIHIIVEDFPYKENINIENKEQWENEKFQRNCISNGLNQLKLNDNDIITICDLDEIPDPDILLKLKQNNQDIGIQTMELDFYYYNLNCKRHEKWYHTKTLSYNKYKELNLSIENIRFTYAPVIQKAGWHLSYFGNAEFIKNKLMHFSHQEYNTDIYTNIETIQKQIETCSDLFNRPNSDMKYIKIEDNIYLPPFFDTFLQAFYEKKVEDNCYNTQYSTIGFHSNQLCERGTEIAMYDYAYYNQKLYNNKSIIFYCKHNPNNNQEVIKKFEKEFNCYAYDKFSDIDKIILDEKINYFYNITGGSNSYSNLVTNCPNLVHAVFTVEPHGEKYATVSSYLANKYNNVVDYVPHMINLPKCSENIRMQLNIPNDAILFGRYGGYYQFDLLVAQNAIKRMVELDPKQFFIFVNTNKFYEHPQIIYIDKIIDPIEKVRFINTCDAMIHARSDGETFGLAVAEFSTLNKPVITCVSTMDNSHIEILGDKAIIYDSEESLIDIFKNIRTIIASRDDWNAYTEYTPEKVMKKFMDVFIPKTIV